MLVFVHLKINLNFKVDLNLKHEIKKRDLPKLGRPFSLISAHVNQPRARPFLLLGAPTGGPTQPASAVCARAFADNPGRSPVGLAVSLPRGTSQSESPSPTTPRDRRRATTLLPAGVRSLVVSPTLDSAGVALTCAGSSVMWALVVRFTSELGSTQPDAAAGNFSESACEKFVGRCVIDSAPLRI
jgi:hypothetical protein